MTFPPSPTNGQQFSNDGITWEWSDVDEAWILVPISTSDVNAAAASAADALSSKVAAGLSEDSAAASAAAAESSKNSAAASASAAASSESTVASSAEFASSSAATAVAKAAEAATSQALAAGSQAAAASSATSASGFAASASESFDSFDDRYLGSKAADPAVDNDGNALLEGALYWNSTSKQLRAWPGAAPWVVALIPASTYATKTGAETLTNKTLTAPVLNGPTGLVKADIGGIDQVDNTTDASKPVSTPQAAAINAQAMGQCRVVLSGGNLVLRPFMGNLLTINGVRQTIPSAGVSLVPTGNTSGQVYHIYAYMNAGVMTLEKSLTGHSTDATTGVEIMTGDATRTLVAKTYAGSAGVWSDSSSIRGIINWFNRRTLFSASPTFPTTAHGATAPAEINGTARAYFLTWGDESVYSSVSGYASNDTAGASVITYCGIDNVNLGPSSAWISPTASAIAPCVVGAAYLPGEGLHFASPMANVSSGIGTFVGCGNHVTFRG